MAAAAPPAQGGERFSTIGIARPRQYAAWREAVSATHCAWDLPSSRDPAFDGRIRRQALGRAEILACACDPCRGRRGRVEIARTERAGYGLLYVLEGRERIAQGGQEAELSPGRFLLWDTTRPIDFQVPGRLRKLTLLLPQAALDALLPNARDLTGRSVDAGAGVAGLLAAHLRFLAQPDNALPEGQQGQVLQATLELLAVALEPVAAGGGDDHRRRLLSRVTGHVLKNLADPELSPERVAAAVGISGRQLHRLFAGSGWTADRWIWHQRLLRCREALAAADGTPVSQIAYRWGFSDAAHFSRAFRRAFGTAPRDFRAGRGGSA